MASIRYINGDSYCFRVNFDIDVPLFLPIYAEARIRDTQWILQKQTEKGWNLHGQMIFESGWEWAFWFQNVVAARATFHNPSVPSCSQTPSQSIAFDGCIEQTIRSSLQIVAKSLMNSADGVDQWTKWMERVFQSQRKLLIQVKLRHKVNH
jgi:hypothetical protein